MENQMIECNKWLELLELRTDVVGNAKPTLNGDRFIEDIDPSISNITFTTSMTITRPR